MTISLGLKSALVVELAKLNFTYTYHITKIVKAGLGFNEIPKSNHKIIS
jgi:hypothetical protein